MPFSMSSLEERCFVTWISKFNIITKRKVGNSWFSNSFLDVLKQRVCMQYTFIPHADSTRHKQLVDHTQGYAPNLGVYLPLEEGDYAWHSFLFHFCVFTWHADILAVELERLLNMRIRIETLSWLRVQHVLQVSKK